jgi:beta-N-acetylhexosaminidase
MKNIFFPMLFLFSLFAELSIEEKIGQILMFPIHGEDFTKQMEDVLNQIHPGGIILYNWANKLTDLEKIKNLTKNLQMHSNIPLFIGIDQEGGRIDRLNLGSQSAKEIGSLLNQDAAMTSAIDIGKALEKIGINLNFAPVVDINSNPENMVIGNRSFGSDPFVVTKFARRFLMGLTHCKIMGCLKHFPGHGDVSSDSHYTLPVSLKNLDELMLCELIPYQKLASYAPFIMTAHILFPNIDPDNQATLSKIFLQDILRKKLNYTGIIITDSLRMGAILTNNLTDIAVKAFNAGNDILLIGGNLLTEKDPVYNIKEIKDLHKNLVEAVKDGRISIQRLEESLKRIEFYKKSLIK